MNQQTERSSHILNASSNLLGICFIVLTSLKVMNISNKTVIDEVTVAAIILFMTSCIFSFLSLKGNYKNSERLETIADIVFISGLSLLFITTILFSLDIIK